MASLFPQLAQTEHGVAGASHGAPSFLFCNGAGAATADSASLETSSGVLDTSPRGGGADSGGRKARTKPREDSASASASASFSFSSAHSKVLWFSVHATSLSSGACENRNNVPAAQERERTFSQPLKKQRITVLDRVWSREQCDSHSLDWSCVAELNKQDSSSKGSTKNRGGKRGRSSKEVDDEEEPKGYIHVRARRGQATDSHSLAERVHTTSVMQHYCAFIRLRIFTHRPPPSCC